MKNSQLNYLQSSMCVVGSLIAKDLSSIALLFLAVVYVISAMYQASKEL
jgi:hypothetical protein